ncbi:MAG TPA: PD-(D/E)XK nuclease family protein [Kofleriaceae bacterium]|nr:PD-(D/E)XK nuclease family protein [Kofleriaceae bacterium]
MPSTRALIHAPWSASKVAMGLRCPRLFHFRYVEKLREPDVMPEARIGKAIHAALESALGGVAPAEAAASARTELTDDAEQRRFDSLAAGVDSFITRIGRFRRGRRVQRTLVEYSLAVREDLTATQFYAGDAYYRGILDVGYIYDEENLAIVDHKTGVRLPYAAMRDQLEGYLVLAASAFRQVRRFWLGVHWVAERAVEWTPPVDLSQVVDRISPTVLDNIEAAALAVDDGPRTNPGPWCDRCSYRAMCPASHQQRWEPVYDDFSDDDDD